MNCEPEMSLGLFWKDTLKSICMLTGKPMQADFFVNVWATF